MIKLYKKFRSHPEFQQSLVRLAFLLFGLVYIGLGSYTRYYPIPLTTYYYFAIIFFIYVILSFWHVIAYPEFKNRVYVTMFLDLLGVTYSVHLTGGASSPLYVMYVWVFVSQAVRFGRKNLYVSAVLSLLSFTTVIIYEQSWSLKTFEAVFLMVCLILIPVYIDLMLKKMNIARREADEANRAKSAFLANMSHELRTPLNAIIGYSDMLAEDAKALGQPQLSADLDKIHMSGQHLLALISNILDLSKIEAGKMGIFIEDVNIVRVIDEVGATVRTLIDKGGNDYHVEYPNAPVSIRADELKLKQVLINLLGNAAKFTENGKIELIIRIKHHHGQDWVIFVVRDNGIGIPEDQSGNLFSPFTQIDASSTRKFGGSGLGLSISHSYCKMMGGDLTLQSVPGEGSCFEVSLPVIGRDSIMSFEEKKHNKNEAYA